MSNDPVEQYKQDNPKRDVAVVGLRDKDGDIFLVRTHKLTEWWQPVGGGVDPEDTSPEEAVVREVKEELGIDIKPSSLTLTLTVPYDFGEGNIYFYTTVINRDTALMQIDTDEIVGNDWFPVKESQNLKAFPATKAYLAQLLKESA